MNIQKPANTKTPDQTRAAAQTSKQPTPQAAAGQSSRRVGDSGPAPGPNQGSHHVIVNNVFTLADASHSTNKPPFKLYILSEFDTVVVPAQLEYWVVRHPGRSSLAEV